MGIHADGEELEQPIDTTVSSSSSGFVYPALKSLASNQWKLLYRLSHEASVHRYQSTEFIWEVHIREVGH